MPNILFASNSISHFPGSQIGQESWAFDSNRVPYSIKMPILTVASSPIFNETTTDETWVHFRVGSLDWYTYNDEKIVELVDDSGVRVVQISYFDRTVEGWYMRVSMDGVTYTDKRYVPMGSSQIRTIDLQVKLGTLNAEFRLYINELLALERVFPYNPANKRHPRYMWIGGTDGNGNVNNYSLYSEIIVADGDTRNARLDLLRPVAAGAYGNWNGPISSLSDDDPTTGITTVSPNQNQSTVLTPYSGANNISNIVQVTTTVRGLNSPTQLQHLIRMSGVDYLTPSFSVPFEKAYQVTDWRQNPATSLPWAATDLTNVEWGFRSIA